MGADGSTDWRAAAASALQWWADAGVDMLVDDLPRDWLAAPEPAVLAPAPVSPAQLADALPATLDAFLAWRGGEAVPEAAWNGVAIAASGPANAAVMVLVDCPDRDDAETGQLLAGASGRLFDRMLAAIGLSRAEVHLAAVCAKRPGAGRVMRDVETRLGQIARHHVALVGPKRLLLMGDAASRAVLGTDRAGARGGLRPLKHPAGITEAVASFHPRFLLDKPAAKAEAWKDLQLLIKGLEL